MFANLACVEVLLDRCRASVASQREALLTCGTSSLQQNPQGGTCNCFCPTCPPQEWPHRAKLPPCTTPAPFTLPPTTTIAPPPHAVAPPPLKPLKIIPPLSDDYLPASAKLLTETTTGMPTAPPGKCRDDGIYRFKDGAAQFSYKKVGKGMCVDKDDAKIPFKKQRELKELNMECSCKEACDSEPACLGFSLNRNDGDYGLAC